MIAHTNQRRGFTLVEVLMALALMAMIMVAAGMAIKAAAVSRAYNAEKTDLVAMCRGVLDRISHDVRLALSFQVPDAQTVTIDMPDGTSHTYVWDGADSGHLTYTVSDGVTSTSAVLTDKVQSFQVVDESPSCSVNLVLAGDLATSQGCLTAIPRKAVY